MEQVCPEAGIWRISHFNTIMEIKSYKNLPIGKYLDIVKVCQKEGVEEIDRQVSILSILYDMDEDSLLNMPILEYQELARKADFLAEETPQGNPRSVGRKYNIAGWELIPSFDIPKMTTAQYVDFQTYMKNDKFMIVEILSCLLVPKGMTYNTGYDILELQKDLREGISVVDANNMIAFFLRKLNDSMRGILIYSRLQMRRMKHHQKVQVMKKITEAEMLLQKSGDGLRMWMQLQRPFGVRGMRSGG